MSKSASLCESKKTVIPFDSESVMKKSSAAKSGNKNSSNTSLDRTTNTFDSDFLTTCFKNEENARNKFNKNKYNLRRPRDTILAEPTPRYNHGNSPESTIKVHQSDYSSPRTLTVCMNNFF